MLIGCRLTGDAQLLDFIRIRAGRSGVDGDLEKLAAGIELTDEIFFVGLRGLMGDFERTGGVGGKETPENLAGLLFGTAAGSGQDGDVQIVGEPGGKRSFITGGQVFGYGRENRKLSLGLLGGLGLGASLGVGEEVGLGMEPQAQQQGHGRKQDMQAFVHRTVYLQIPRRIVTFVEQ